MARIEAQMKPWLATSVLLITLYIALPLALLFDFLKIFGSTYTSLGYYSNSSFWVDYGVHLLFRGSLLVFSIAVFSMPSKLHEKLFKLRLHRLVLSTMFLWGIYFLFKYFMFYKTWAEGLGLYVDMNSPLYFLPTALLMTSPILYLRSKRG